MKFNKLNLIAALLCSTSFVFAAPATPPNRFTDSEQVLNLPQTGTPVNTREVIDKNVQDFLDVQLTPEQVAAIKRTNLEQQRATVSPYPSTAKPVTRSISVDLNPGAAPPVLRLSKGMLTNIVFSDIGGNPWIIERVAYNSQLFSDGRGDPQGGRETDIQPTNILSLEPIHPAGYGNVSVTLKGLATPVVFILTSGQSEVDVRIDARLSGTNPDGRPANAAQMQGNVMSSLDQDTVAFIDGVPPASAKQLISSEKSVNAWIYNGQLIVRTNNTSIYPDFKAMSRSTSGQNVYRYSEPYQVVTFSIGGQPVNVYFEQQ